MVREGSPNDVVLWRFQVIAPLLSLAGPRGTLKRAIRKLAEQPHTHPHKGVIRIGAGTIEEWLYRYRRHGLLGLEDKKRRDLGQSRLIHPELAERISDLATGRPQLDGPGLLRELAAQGVTEDQLPSLSTLYRFLRRHGLDQRSAPARQDHRAYAFDLAGDCWQGDVMYGPTLPTRDGRRRKIYLIAIIDDATRVVVHAQFYAEQHLRSLKDCLKQAMLKRGVPRRFYFDNGQIFRSRLLLALCARLGIHLIHSRPYQPQGRAKIERWFLTVRKCFLARIDLDRVADIDALNRLLFAWIEGEYHQTPHRGIDGEKPLERWLRLSDGVRPLPLDVPLDALFADEVVRRVGKDGTLSLAGRRFEAGPRFIGQKVRVRFDPFDLRRVMVTGPSGDSADAFPVDLAANRHVRRQVRPAQELPAKPPPLRAIEDLMQRREDHDEDEDQGVANATV